MKYKIVNHHGTWLVIAPEQSKPLFSSKSFADAYSFVQALREDIVRL
jgi:hypothetical protein